MTEETPANPTHHQPPYRLRRYGLPSQELHLTQANRLDVSIMEEDNDPRNQPAGGASVEDQTPNENDQDMVRGLKVLKDSVQMQEEHIHTIQAVIDRQMDTMNTLMSLVAKQAGQHTNSSSSQPTTRNSEGRATFDDDVKPPKPFKGNEKDDPQTFMDRLERYAQYKFRNSTADWKQYIMDIIWTYLSDMALSWYTSQDEPFTDFDNFRDRFFEHYTGVTTEQWVDEVLIKMKRGETQNAYIGRFEQMAKKFGYVGQCKLVLFRLNILPEYRAAISTRDVKSFEDAVRKVRSMSSHTDMIKSAKPDSVVALEHKITELEKLVKKHNVSDAEHKTRPERSRNGFGHQLESQDAKSRQPPWRKQQIMENSRESQRQSKENSTPLRYGDSQPCHICKKKGHLPKDCWWGEGNAPPPPPQKAGGPRQQRVQYLSHCGNRPTVSTPLHAPAEARRPTEPGTPAAEAINEIASALTKLIAMQEN